MREAQAYISIRWFIGCGCFHDRLPDHSSLTRIRRRWGEARFRKIFRRTESVCIDAGVAKGEVVHADATLIRTDAGWKSMVDRHAEAVASGNGDAAAKSEMRKKGIHASGLDRRASNSKPSLDIPDRKCTIIVTLLCRSRAAEPATCGKHWRKAICRSGWIFRLGRGSEKFSQAHQSRTCSLGGEKAAGRVRRLALPTHGKSCPDAETPRPRRFSTARNCVRFAHVSAARQLTCGRIA